MTPLKQTRDALNNAQLLGRGEILIESIVWKIFLKTVASDDSPIIVFNIAVMLALY